MEERAERKAEGGRKGWVGIGCDEGEIEVTMSCTQQWISTTSPQQCRLGEREIEGD